MNIEEATTQIESEDAPVVEQSGAADQVSALDILKEMQSGAEQQVGTKADEQPAEADESEVESNDDADEDSVEDEDDIPDDEVDDEADVPALDAAILETLEAHNPEAVKRWNEQWAGLQKRESRVTDWEAGIQDLFTDREYLAETLPGFIAKLADAYGTSPQGLLADLGLVADAAMVSLDEGEDDNRFSSPVEREHDAKLKALTQEIERLNAQQREQAQAGERSKMLDQQTRRVQKALERDYRGFNVTRRMVEDAVKQFPSIDPIQAFKGQYADKLIDHARARLAKAQAVAAKPMPKAATSKGGKLPEGDAVRAVDLLQFLPDR